MDFLQDYMPQAFRYLTDSDSPYTPYLGSLLRYLYLSQSYFYRFVFPYVWPAYKLGNNALKMVSPDAPDMATLALLAVILFISLKLLNILRQTILGWISVVLKLSKWTLVAAVGLYVWQRGLEQSLEDLGWAVGFIAGLENEGERIGNMRASRKTRDATRIPTHRPRGRTRGAGWN